MRLSAVPEQNDVPADVTQEVLKELDNLRRTYVLVRVELAIQPQASSLGRDRKRRDGRDFCPIASRRENGRLTPRSPCARDRRNEQESALVKEARVGSKFCGFFLSEATRAASSIEWLFRSAPGPALWASDNSSPYRASASRHSESCSGRQTHDE